MRKACASRGISKAADDMTVKKSGSGGSLQVAWYDLPSERISDYLQWLHGSYLPEVLQHSGILWVAHYKLIKDDETVNRLSEFVGRPPELDSLPAGSEYALLIGAESPHVFFAHDYEAINDQDPVTREMLRLRQGTRVAVCIEQDRVHGPEFETQDANGTPAPAIQLGHFRVRSVEEEFDLAKWYLNYRLPAIASMTGAVGARKFVTLAGWVKHVILYEFVSLDAHKTHFLGHESLAFKEGEWTNKVVTYAAHAPGSPGFGYRIWPEADSTENK